MGRGVKPEGCDGRYGWEGNAPRTCHRGSNPIDTIMCLANVILRKDDYFPFVNGTGDHHPVLLDIEEMSFFGAKGSPSMKV